MAENDHLPLTWHIALTTVYALTCYTVILGVSCFVILAGNCLFMAKFLGVWGVNRGLISIFHFISPKSTSLRDSASFEPLRVKIRPGVSSLVRWSEKKK